MSVFDGSCYSIHKNSVYTLYVEICIVDEQLL